MTKCEEKKIYNNSQVEIPQARSIRFVSKNHFVCSECKPRSSGYNRELTFRNRVSYTWLMEDTKSNDEIFSVETVFGLYMLDNFSTKENDVLIFFFKGTQKN